MDGLMSKLRKLDAYPKVNEDFYSRTLSGGIEKALQRHGGRLEHNETCCGSCYGAETSAEDCCNSCEEVLEAYRKKGWAMTNTEFNGPICKNKLYECRRTGSMLKRGSSFKSIMCKREGFLQRIEDEEGEGCSIYGFLEVNKVAGNFHFAPGKSFQQSGVHAQDLLAFQKDSFNFSVTEHFRGADIGRHQSLPGVFFFYDLSPIKVTFTEEHVSFLNFLTNVCAIVGVSCSALLQLSPFSQVLNNARTGYWP